MIKIGNRTVIFSETMLCPIGENIGLELSVPDEDEAWCLSLIFTEAKEDDSADDKIPRLRVHDDDGTAIITFHNWINNFGSSISQPYDIAIGHNGRPISILAEAAKLTGLYRVNLQIMMEDKPHG